MKTKPISQKQYRYFIKTEASNYAQEVKLDFEKLVLGHISATMEKTPLAALILMLCAIDYLKSFNYGLLAIDDRTLDVLTKRYKYDHRNKYLNIVKKRRITIKKGPGKYYISFLKDYLKPKNKKYHIIEIYKNLRCGLVHNYSDHIFKYDFIDNRDINFGDRTNEHLTKYKRNNKIRVKFNIDTFFKDFLSMCDDFWTNANNNIKIQMNIHDIKSYVGFMHVFPEQSK